MSSWSSQGVDEQIVINTGPLIALAHADALEVAGRLPLRFLAPLEVRRELDAGATSGLLTVDPAWLTVRKLSPPLHPITRTALDAGEAAVIELAQQQDISWVCIDERKGRRAAFAMGLRVTETLGLLARAKRLGIISAVAPFARRLEQAGVWFHPELVQALLEGVGEQ